MVSRKWGLVVGISPKRGLHVYFRKKASAFNQCVGDKLRGKTGTRAQIRSNFAAAARACK